MKLFSKKPPREIKEDDSTLVKLWYNPRTHAMIVLGAYLIFFLILILIANTSSNTKKNQNKKSGSDLEKYFINLDNKNISYNHTVSKNNEMYYFSLADQDDDNIYGTLLHNAEVKKILISKEACTIGEYNNEEFTPSEGSCPDIDYSLFFYQNIYDKVENLNSLNSVKSDKYIFKISDKITYTIYVDKDIISKIEIKKGADNYTLNYSVVNSDDNIENLPE